MASRNKRVNQGRLSERRRLRSGCLADALRLQLEACREEEGLAAIVVSDELGFCVAHAGGDGNHEELAAQLPMLADPARESVDDDDGVLQPGAALAVTTFSAAGARLHACTVKDADAAAETDESDAEVLARVASGFTRLLAQ
jgi:hypothetical protein